MKRSPILNTSLLLLLIVLSSCKRDIENTSPSAESPEIVSSACHFTQVDINPRSSSASNRLFDLVAQLNKSATYTILFSSRSDFSTYSEIQITELSDSINKPLDLSGFAAPKMYYIKVEAQTSEGETCESETVNAQLLEVEYEEGV